MTGDLRLSASLSSWWLGAATAVVLVLLVPLSLAQDPFGTASSLPGLLSMLVLALSGGKLALFVVEARPRYMALCFWVFTYVWFGLAGFLQVDIDVWARRTAFVGTPYSGSLQARAQIVVLVGCAAYELGYRVRKVPVVTPEPEARMSHRFSMMPLVIASWLAIGVSLYFLGRAGPAVFRSRLAVSAVEGLDPDKQIKTFLFAVSVVAAWAIGPYGPIPWRSHRGAVRYLFAAVIILTLVVCNPVSTQRGQAGAVYGAVLLALTRKASRRSVRTIAITVMAGTIIVFPALDLFRGTDRGSSYEEVLQSRDLSTPLRDPTGSYGMYSEVADGVDYVDRFGHTDGVHLTSTALVFVPRSVWSGKAEDLANTVSRRLGYPAYFNFASPLWMEFYVEGGFILLAIGFGLYAKGSSLLDRALIGAERSHYLTAIAPALAAYQLYLLRGPLQTTAALGGMLVVVAWLSFPRVRPASPATRRQPAAIPSRLRVGPGGP